MANTNGTVIGNRTARVLWFTADSLPTDDDYEGAQRFQPNVSFRNGRMVADLPMSPLEECDAVAGPAIPARYAAVYPDVGNFSGSHILRMSDLDRPFGLPSDINNEAARAAKPPAVGQDRIVAQGAARPVGALTTAQGGFVAPRPQRDDALPAWGSERAENAPQGTQAGSLAGTIYNPHGLPEGGVTAVGDGGITPSHDDDASGATVEQPQGAGSGFQAPEPAKDEGEDEAAKSKTKASKAK